MFDGCSGKVFGVINKILVVGMREYLLFSFSGIVYVV